MTHDELAASLAGHLRTADRMVWCDMQLGPAGSPRPDVFTVNKSFARPCLTAYECKVSMSDFRADVTVGKWQTYLPYASGVYFACEAGLLTKNDVPEHCGLMVYSGSAWRAAKKATLRAATSVPQDAWLKLLIDGVEREGPRHRRKHYIEDLYLMRLSAKFGAIAAKTIQDRLRVESEVEAERSRAARMIADAQFQADRLRTEAAAHVEPIYRELRDILGLPEGDQWALRAEVAKIRNALIEHPAQGQLRRLTKALDMALRREGLQL